MSSGNDSRPGTTGAARYGLEDIIERFEAAWQRGERPEPEAYLPAEEGERRLVLRELVHADLEWRLKGGEPARVEEYLRRFPELAGQPGAVVGLAAAEFGLRRRREPALSLAEYADRFPDHASELGRRLESPSPTPANSTLQSTVDQPEKPAPPAASPDGEREQARYRPLRFHARGGLGEVHVAEDVELQREVALKRIQERFADHPDSRRLFLREAQITARLGHPGIVPVHGLVHDEHGRPCYAMRLIEGESLQKAIERFHEADRGPRDPGERSLALRELLSLLVAVCNTVAYAHSRGVLHCDLKPANVMLGNYGETLVIDWGLARLFAAQAGPAGGGSPRPAGGDDGRGTKLGEVRGTPAFMSPEQADGRWDVVGPASDVYSLGATLYVLLTGRAPFAGRDPGEVLRRVRSGTPRRPRQVNAAVPPALEAVCLRALAPRPEQRYASALALADDLRHWLADEPVAAYREPLPARLARWRRRHRTPVAVAGFVLLTLAAAAAIGALVVGRERQRARALAEADALADAGAAGVPALLRDLAAHRADALPRLRERWRDAGLSDTRRLRLGLALADDPEVRDRLVALARTADDPADLLLVRDALLPWAAETRAGLWAPAAEALTPAGERLRLLVLLAALDPEGDAWAGQAAPAADTLVRENVLVVGRWAEALRPVRGRLLPPLIEVFRATGRPESERSVAAGLLADYAADRPDVLADVLLDADPRTFAALFPRLEAHRERAVALLCDELGKTAAAEWKDPPPDPAWAAPDPALVGRVESAQGLVAERFAFCQALPLAELDAVAAGLRGAGYRLTRLRPYAVAASGPLAGSSAAAVQVAAVWARDGRDWHAAHGLTADEVRRQDAERRQHGYQPADVAGYLAGGRERYAALWVKADGEDDARLYVGVPEDRHKADGWGPLRDAKLNPVTGQVFRDASGEARYSAVWRKQAPPGSVAWDDDEGSCRDRGLADGLPVDVSLWYHSGYIDDVRAELLGWLSGSPWCGLMMRRQYSLTPHPERGYACCFHANPAFDHVMTLGLTPGEQLRQGRELAAQGYRPAALSVTVIPVPHPAGSTLTAAVWHRPAVPPEAKERLARRQARGAVALLRLGQAEQVWPLLRHRPDPRVRTYLLHFLKPLGADARALVRRLTEEPDVSARRALLLGLGEFGDEQLPAADRVALVPALRRAHRDDPDPGIHGAAEWLLRQWHEEAKLRDVERELATGKVEGGRRWYVNGQGQTLAVIAGGEFLMGSPRGEAGRSGGATGKGETRHRRRIDRTFALATKEVTVGQFQRFRAMHYYVKSYLPTAEHPVDLVSWYDAAEYCNWLSKQEGIPEDQWCYLPNGQGKYAPGMRARSKYLHLSGYRLPTEAEWECACRAGAVTSYPYGETPELLGKYAWYTDVSKNRGMLAVGSLRPNDLGMFDMMGNVSEWCQESIYYYDPGAHGLPAGDPEHPEDLVGIPARMVRIMRGGGFANPPAYLRPAMRNWITPENRYEDVGFRPARTLP